jgi:hypothetical protein
MRTFQRLLLIPVVVSGLALGACTAEVEDEGSLPDVEVQGGDMPNIDIEPADINVTTDTSQVITPDVDIVPANP